MTPVAETPPQTPASSIRVFALTAAMFAVWGVALWLYNSLFFKFAKFFTLDPASIAWMLASFHIAYVCLAIPAVLFHRQFGYKLGLLAGLSVFAIGAFLLYLALTQDSSLYFLAAVVVIGACGAWLETTLNPLAIVSGRAATAVKRMNLAHVFNGIGLSTACIIGIALLGKDYVLSGGVTAQSSARPYVLVGLGAILVAFLIEQIAFPDFAGKGTHKAMKAGELKAEFGSFATSRSFLFAAASLFAYGAVLTILWTSSYRYQHVELPGHTTAIFERGWFWFVAGRIFITGLMRWIDPMRLLQWSTGACVVAIGATAFTGGMTGWVALISASFFLSIAYPTMLGTALCQNMPRILLATGLLVLACGLGNALSSLGSSFALDALQMSPRAVVLAALPFAAVILGFAWWTRKTPVAAVEPAAALHT